MDKAGHGDARLHGDKLGIGVPERVAWPGYTLDLARGDLLDAHGRPVELRAQALRVLLALGEEVGQVVAKDALLRRVWGDVVVTDDSLIQAISDIRRAIGDTTHERVRTVPRRGYTLDAEPPVALAGTDLPASAGEPGLPPVHDAAISLRSGRRGAMLGALLLMAAILVAGWSAWSSHVSLARSLAVLPFESDVDGGAEAWFADGITNDLTTTLSGLSNVAVVGRGTMVRYKGKQADPRSVASELGVRYIVTGRTRRDGDKVRLAISLVEGQTGYDRWSETRIVPRAELWTMVGDVAAGLARTLAVELGDAVGAHARSLSADKVSADDLAMMANAELLRGVTPEHFEKAREMAERAVALDPRSVLGLGVVSLANSNLLLWDWAKDPNAVRARAAEASAQLDLIAPGALVAALARASLANVRRDWLTLAAIGDRLVADFPNDPTAHHHRCSALLRLDRFEDSLAACARAMRISPRDSRMSVWHALSGFNAYQLGRHDQAERHLRDAVASNPRVAFYTVLLPVVVAEQGRLDEAVTLLKEATDRHPTFRASWIGNYWVATAPRFVSGRDRAARIAVELGLPE